MRKVTDACIERIYVNDPSVGTNEFKYEQFGPKGKRWCYFSLDFASVRDGKTFPLILDNALLEKLCPWCLERDEEALDPLYRCCGRRLKAILARGGLPWDYLPPVKHLRRIQWHGELQLTSPLDQQVIECLFVKE